MKTLQVIFENRKTETHHNFHTSIVFPHLPRMGEVVSLYRGDDDEPILNGIVREVRWSICEDEYAVFLSVEPL